MNSEYFLRRRQIAQGLIAKEDRKKEPKPLKKSTKPIPKRSEKMKGIISALHVLYDKFLKDKTEHHTKGRGVKVILDETYWKACCSACNLYVERKDAEARDKGHKVSRHAKN